jgi:carbohydrate kinase (thermoresistant glucokinase family)
MGVSGSDKPAARAVLAIRPDGVFVDEDALHSPANIAKTRTGEPLGNFDRAPWLSASPAHVDDWRAAESAEGMPCSALKHGYRNAIIERWNEVSLVYFKGSSTLIGKHLVARRGSPSPASPLEHQIATLEPPSAEEVPTAAVMIGRSRRLSRTLSPPCHCGRRA